MRSFGWLILVVAATACGSGSSGGGDSSSVPLMPGFDPGPAPAAGTGFQIVLPPVTNIEPGQSYEYCTDTSYIVPEDVWVNANQGMQTETGHHVLFFYTMTHVAPGTHLCAPTEMGEFQFGLPAGGGPEHKRFTLPGNLAVKLPKGAQIIVNHHYLNASEANVAQAQSAINVYYADPSAGHTASSMMVVTDTNLTVPSGASSFTEDCTVNQTYSTWMQIPHMHSYGSHIQILYTPAATGVTRPLVDMDWTPDDALDFESVATSEDLSAPFVFNKGDKVHIKCDYLNPTKNDVAFGTEMCVMANMTVDKDNIGSWACNAGHWSPM